MKYFNYNNYNCLDLDIFSFSLSVFVSGELNLKEDTCMYYFFCNMEISECHVSYSVTSFY